MILGVVDASVALAWGLPDQRSPYADSVLEGMAGGPVLAPGIWSVEIANGLLMAERRKRIAPTSVSAFLRFLDQLGVVREPFQGGGLPVGVVDLAREHGLTAYDAVYLELAVRRRLPLATLDKKLAAAARRAGVSRLGDG